ncbi:hypothetical protein, conserved [Eimeria tenella]|uniref:Uncharacterized protein n=1 Tax=Eimeria tenella TaxID=5802 RepID=U6KYC2_EIMTE|nr:hypothetical protein, conserved [Eimeria tenella]CDJ43182.1 hypothetical protein, conserved [Eimeria tenella]|eukprot:XP_013233932.1 hypothetical protein, conserved [Eimeria tenella]
MSAGKSGSESATSPAAVSDSPQAASGGSGDLGKEADAALQALSFKIDEHAQPEYETSFTAGRGIFGGAFPAKAQRTYFAAAIAGLLVLVLAWSLRTKGNIEPNENHLPVGGNTAVPSLQGQGGATGPPVQPPVPQQPQVQPQPVTISQPPPVFQILQPEEPPQVASPPPHPQEQPQVMAAEPSKPEEPKVEETPVTAKGIHKETNLVSEKKPSQTELPPAAGGGEPGNYEPTAPAAYDPGVAVHETTREEEAKAAAQTEAVKQKTTEASIALRAALEEFLKHAGTVGADVQHDFARRYISTYRQDAGELSVTSYVENLVLSAFQLQPEDSASLREKTLHLVRVAFTASLVEAMSVRIQELKASKQRFMGSADATAHSRRASTGSTDLRDAVEQPPVDFTPVKFSYFLKKFNKYLGGISDAVKRADKREKEAGMTTIQGDVTKYQAECLMEFLAGSIIQILGDKKVPDKMAQRFSRIVGDLGDFVDQVKGMPHQQTWINYLYRFECPAVVIEKAEQRFSNLGIFGALTDFLSHISQVLVKRRTADHHDPKYLEHLEKHWNSGQLEKLAEEIIDADRQGKEKAFHHKLATLEAAGDLLEFETAPASEVDVQLFRAGIALL